MEIYLTFDYELFFGEKSGSVEKCLIEPTNNLFEIARNKNVSYTFFVDVGFLIAADKYNDLKIELSQVKTQVKQMIQLGHSVQLHIHPHWEKAVFENGVWSMNVDGAYKLADFSQEEAENIVRKYKSYLDDLIGYKTTTFRAGGWCIQPFSQLKDVFKELNLFVDTSVFRGAYLNTKHYSIDFRNTPSKSKYSFSTDVTVEDAMGDFTEYPISSMRYSPSFFWWLYGLGRLFPKQHKMIGDGFAVGQGGRKWQILTSYTSFHVSSDGYYAKKLNASLQKSIHLNHKEMVVIGHPKAMTLYSKRMLDSFIQMNEMKHQFSSF